MTPNQDTSVGISNLFLNPKSGEEWDIVIESGQILTITGIEYLTQKITQLLRTAQGEIIEDDSYGIPYFQSILGVKNPDLSAIQQIFIDTILSNQTLIDLGVTDCTIEDISLDNRKLSILGMKIKADGAEVELEEMAL